MRKDINYFAINNKKTPYFYPNKCDIYVISLCKRRYYNAKIIIYL